MKTHFHLIVIGAGAGGLGPAIGMARFGFDVLLIEKNPENFGGDCLNTGCIPSKAIIHLAQTAYAAKTAQGFGFEVSGKVDWAAAKAYIKKKQDKIWQHESPEYLEKEEGITVKIGEACFTGKKQVSVGGNTYTAQNIVVATGSRPKEINIPGAESVPVYTNESLFQLDNFPQNLLVIGGGPIGVEMGQAFSRLGSEVTILDQSDRILSKELPEVSALLQERLTAEGLRLALNASLVKMEGGTAHIQSAEATSQIAVDGILLAIGRELKYDSLNLEKANVQVKNGKPVLDKYLRAKGNKNVYFAGDAVGGPFFSHAAEVHTTAILTNFFAPGPFKKKYSLDNFSWVTFTDPQVATFGLSPREIEERNIKYQKIDFPFANDDRAIAGDYEYGRLILFAKVNRLNPRKGKILGGTVVAPNAGEMIQELILARENGLGLDALFNKTYPYPTQSRVNKVALVEKFGSEISDWIKTSMKILYK